MREVPVRDISGDVGGNLRRLHEGSTIEAKDDRAQKEWRAMKEAKPSGLDGSSMPCTDGSLCDVCSCIRCYQVDMWSVTAQLLPFWGVGRVVGGANSQKEGMPQTLPH